MHPAHPDLQSSFIQTTFNERLIYAHVSTDDQVHGYSVQPQLEAYLRYASNWGYRVAAEFRDDYSKSLDHPGLNELREFVSRDSTGMVIVSDVDHLARKSVYQMLIEEELARSGATAKYVLGQ